MRQEYSIAEVTQHATPGDCWVAVDGHVLDVSSFAKMHPGGELLLLSFAGKDATEAFFDLHRHDVLLKYIPRLRVGVLSGHTPKALAPKAGELSTVPFAEPSSGKFLQTRGWLSGSMPTR